MSTTLRVSKFATFGADLFRHKKFSRKILSNSSVGGQRTLSLSDSRVCRNEKKTSEERHLVPNASPKKNVRLLHIHKKCVWSVIFIPPLFLRQAIHSKPTIVLFVKKRPAKIRFAYHATAFLSSCKLNCQRMQKYGRYSTVNVATDENVDDIPGEYCN